MHDLTEVTSLEGLMHIYGFTAEEVGIAYVISQKDYNGLFSKYYDRYKLIGDNFNWVRAALFKKSKRNIRFGRNTIVKTLKYWLICGKLYEVLAVKMQFAYYNTFDDNKRNLFMSMIRQLIVTSMQNGIMSQKDWESFKGEDNSVQVIFLPRTANKNSQGKKSESDSNYNSNERQHIDIGEFNLNITFNMFVQNNYWGSSGTEAPKYSNKERDALIKGTRANIYLGKEATAPEYNHDLLSKVELSEAFYIVGMTENQILALRILVGKGAGKYLEKGIGVLYDNTFHILKGKKGTIITKALVAYYFSLISDKLKLYKYKSEQDTRKKKRISWKYFQYLTEEEGYALCKRDWVENGGPGGKENVIELFNSVEDEEKSK